jgi:enoyl-CoA hydratase
VQDADDAHLIGPVRTKQAVILANQRRISAAEAHERGPGGGGGRSRQGPRRGHGLATKVAAQLPLSVAMTKSTVNRLAHALDDLASHMDVDLFALASMTEDHKEGVAAFSSAASRSSRGR